MAFAGMDQPERAPHGQRAGVPIAVAVLGPPVQQPDAQDAAAGGGHRHLRPRAGALAGRGVRRGARARAGPVGGAQAAAAAEGPGRPGRPGRGPAGDVLRRGQLGVHERARGRRGGRRCFGRGRGPGRVRCTGGRVRGARGALCF